jgi:flagellar M-ring protein FliF
MDFARRYWTTIRAQMEGLPASTKLLIGSLVVILLLVGFIALLYAGKPETVPISRFASGQSEEVAARLDAAGIDAELRDGQVYVPSHAHLDAIAILAREELLADNASSAFTDITGSPWETDAQGNRKYLLATQKYLSAIAKKFKGVRSAAVIISMPEEVGFGRSSVRPSASVTVTMNGSQAVDKHLVNAMAGLVSGAVAKMEPTDVVVLDANHGRQHTVADPQDIVPTEVIELIRHQEEYNRRKIEQMLGHIPGVIVAVKVSTNPVRREVREELEYSPSEQLKSEEDTEMISRDFQRANEAGARPNTTLSIDTGNAVAREQTETTSRREYDGRLLTGTKQIEMAGHQVEQINVTINVPRSYFVNIFNAKNPDTQDAPDDAAIEPIKTDQLTRIVDQVKPLIAISEDAPGVVHADMVYDMAYLQPAVAGSGSGGGGVLGTVTDSNTVATVSAGALAVISLGLALMMVRRATKPEALPTVEELAGVPPTLPTDDELIGEADEVESTMTGLEVDEEELRTRRLAEQISDLIKSAPDDAGNLLGKWVQAED